LQLSQNSNYAEINEQNGQKPNKIQINNNFFYIYQKSKYMQKMMQKMGQGKIKFK